MVYLSPVYLSNQTFRTVFRLKNKTILHWFPGHMGKGVKQMQTKLKSVDCIIEVHDARIPFSGRNPESFQTISGLRPHILVYNKRDLADEAVECVIIDKLKENGTDNVIFTNCKDSKCQGVKRIIPLVQKLVKSNQRFNRSENLDSCLMVIGVPNVGKSTLINALRAKFLHRGNAASVGANPGITRSVGEKIKISEDPLIYVLDTPGILTPKVPSVDVGMKLALCATIPDKEVGIEHIADYLLFWLNKNENFSYVDYFKLDRPTDEISEVLTSISIQNNLYIKSKDVQNRLVQRPHFHKAASTFVDVFRRGVYGPVNLDCDNIGLDKKETQKFIISRKHK